MFFAYMLLGRIATLLMLVYIGILCYRYYKTNQLTNVSFVVQADFEEPEELVGDFEPLDELTDFKPIE